MREFVWPTPYDVVKPPKIPAEKPAPAPKPVCLGLCFP